MELFENIVDSTRNFLPQDGTGNYYGKILNQKEAYEFYETLLETIEWENDETVIFGKKIITKRKVAWYGDENFEYTYSNSTKNALPWTKELLALKTMVEEKTEEIFNSCLLNLYHDGSEGMSYHSDGEKDLKKNGAIASLSFGAERRFLFKHKFNQEKIEIFLKHGSLLVMKDQTQSFWLHRLPPTKKVFLSRINLTFRMIEKKTNLNFTSFFN
jgi:alkylated DNA repair dioxygenase AlkB